VTWIRSLLIPKCTASSPASAKFEARESNTCLTPSVRNSARNRDVILAVREGAVR
jgi:hypothetical protein